jgi:hypothetical protein
MRRLEHKFQDFFNTKTSCDRFDRNVIMILVQTVMIKGLKLSCQKKNSELKRRASL